jgi:SAM-dependent methyltransferase
MAIKASYRDYVADEKALQLYDTYQNRYRDSIRESDKVLIKLVSDATNGNKSRLLDVGCSTGNLLRHLKRLMPHLELHGCDLASSSIEKCKADPELSNISFEIRDMLSLTDYGAQFDVITANAVGQAPGWDDYVKAIKSVSQALKPADGTYFAFEWLHPFSSQEITFIETSQWNPDGLALHARPFKKVEALFHEAGFSSIEFRPFELPIDLPFPGYDADVVTFTRKDEHGRRMAFRGAILQPWCHLVARK